MPTKTEKKLENAIVTALTRVCEAAKERDIGFEWITHAVDYKDIPNSLIVTCVFADQQSLYSIHHQGIDSELVSSIQWELSSVNIALSDPEHHVKFDTEIKGSE